MYAFYPDRGKKADKFICKHWHMSTTDVLQISKEIHHVMELKRLFHGITLSVVFHAQHKCIRSFQYLVEFAYIDTSSG